MLNGYLYTGPLPLGSVVAHNRGAAGLFSDKVNPEVLREAIEVDGLYRLTVTIGETVKLLMVIFHLWSSSNWPSLIALSA